MTPEGLQRLLARGETLDVEFKSELREGLGDRPLLEAITCLANRAGAETGWLLVGVEDDGRVTGARPRHGDSTESDRLAALIANRTVPPLSVRIHQVPYEGHVVLTVEVPPQRHPVGTSDGVFLRRGFGGDGRPACLPLDATSMLSLQSDRGLLDPSARLIPDANWDDLDPLEFDRFRRSIRERRGRSDESLLDLSNRELAQALGVIEPRGIENGLRLAALLLFGHEDTLRRFVPSHEAAFQVGTGVDVAVNDFFRWPLLRLMEEFEARIRSRNSEQELMVGLLRVGIPEVSERALREAIANAFIHRDYQRMGAVHLQWNEDGIVISNPGGFPEGVHLNNLLVTAPQPRNPLLADAFKRAGIVERTARGIDTIYLEQLRNGRPAPSYERSHAFGVTVFLPGGAAQLGFVRLLVQEAQAGVSLGLDGLIILRALWQERSVTTRTAAALTQRTEHEARGALQHLAEAGLVQERGRTKGRSWHLSALAYRALGDRVAYVRQRGFEPLQQEQMVMQFLEAHGRITRAEVAHLCKISDDQAYRLLRRLLKTKQLLPDGTRGRNVGYRKSDA